MRSKTPLEDEKSLKNTKKKHGSVENHKQPKHKPKRQKKHAHVASFHPSSHECILIYGLIHGFWCVFVQASKVEWNGPLLTTGDRAPPCISLTHRQEILHETQHRHSRFAGFETLQVHRISRSGMFTYH